GGVAVQGGALQKTGRPGPPSRFRCRECGGALGQIDDDPNRRFRCHVGHGFTADGLMTMQDERVEAALWTAVRELEERTELRRQMAERARRGGLDALARAYATQAEASNRPPDGSR